MAEPARNHVMNCGYGKGFSVLEVLDAVERASNQKIARVFQARRPGDPASLTADNSAILAHLPWRPQRDNLDMIVTDALNWERKLGERQV
jgi:UDP-glucose 4-epimerase